MKAFFVILHDGLFRQFDNTLRRLAQEGHEITLSIGKAQKSVRTDAALKACINDLDSLTFYPEIIKRQDRWRRLLAYSRGIVSYHFATQPAHPWSAIENKKRFYRSFPKRWRKRIMRLPLLESVLQTGGLLWLMKQFEKISPPDKTILHLLETEQPHVLIAAPFIYLRSLEIEYVKAAQALGIPTAAVVTSWDHLTTKDTFQLMPDMILVWNKWLYDDAIKLHHVPEDRLFITGAPVYDSWFGLTPSQDREAFCAMLGLDPARPYLAYLCSSTTISADEHLFVQEMLDAMAQDPAMRDLQVVIRPHPLNTIIWKDFEAPGTVVYPKQGSLPEVDDARQGYFDTLAHSIGAFGINTTGFLDAAVAGKPCVTLLTERYEETQIKRGHFHYLLEGEFIQVARSFEDLITIFKDLLAGLDRKGTQRHQFLQDFLRPHGLDQEASAIFSQAVTLLAQGQTPTQIREKMPWLKN